MSKKVKVQKVERVEEETQPKSSISSELAELRKEIAEIQNKGAETSEDLLKKAKLRDMGDIEDVVSNAISLLNQISPKNEGKARGVFNSLMSSLPFAKKVKNKLEKTVIENSSMTENVESIHKAIDKSLAVMEGDLDNLMTISDNLGATLKSGKEKEEVLNKFLNQAKKDGRRMDVVHARRLLVQLQAINLSNEEALNGLEMQIRSSEQMSVVLSEILPILKPTFYNQMTIAYANANNERTLKTMEVASQTINEVMKINKEATNGVILDTLALSNKKIIEADTIKEFDVINKKFQKDLKAQAIKMIEGNREYKAILEKHSSNVLEQKKETERILLEAATDESSDSKTH